MKSTGTLGFGDERPAEDVRASRPKMRHAIGCVSLLLFGLLLVVLTGKALQHQSQYFEPRAFESQAWKEAAWNGRTMFPEPVRIEMVDSLLAGGGLIGLKREEVVKTMGPDDGASGTGFSVHGFGDWDDVYWLGPERAALRVDSEWLVIRYDDRGRVFECALQTD